MRWHKALLIGLLTMAALLPGSVWLARVSALGALEPQLVDQLAPRMQMATLNSYGALDVANHLVEELNKDLAQIDPGGTWPLLQACHARVQFLQQTHRPATARQVEIPWEIGGQHHFVRLNLGCRTNWPGAAALALTLALFPALLTLALPQPLGTADRRVMLQLRDMGYQQDISPEQRRWLLQQNPSRLRLLQVFANQGVNLNDAVTQLQQPVQLRFDMQRLQASLFGMPLQLSRTPLLYFYWYAKHRLSKDASQGWLVNPASNRPDTAMASELLALLEAHQGNARAIRELRENGLRARTLDQNRSKIREEVSALLGEELTDQFLFEIQRDQRTARYAFRLALQPDQIEL